MVDLPPDRAPDEALSLQVRRNQIQLMRKTWLWEVLEPLERTCVLAESTRVLGKKISEMFEPIERSMANLRGMMESTAKSVARLREDVQRSAINAGEVGWFLPMNYALRDFGSLAQAPAAQVSARMENYWRENHADELELAYSILQPNDPERCLLLQDAIWAHEQKRFTLSIPVLLAQSEGLYYQKTRGELFSTIQGKRVPAGVSGQDFINFYAQIFRTHAPISALKKDPDNNLFPERHGVMHGRSLSYGTEVNSLKAISLCCLCTLAELDLQPTAGR